MIFITMFSRMYVGVHTSQDILVGTLLGVLDIFTVSKITKFVLKKPNVERRFIKFKICKSLAKKVEIK